MNDYSEQFPIPDNIYGVVTQPKDDNNDTDDVNGESDVVETQQQEEENDALSAMNAVDLCGNDEDTTLLTMLLTTLLTAMLLRLSTTVK